MDDDVRDFLKEAEELKTRHPELKGLREPATVFNASKKTLLSQEWVLAYSRTGVASFGVVDADAKTFSLKSRADATEYPVTFSGDRWTFTQKYPPRINSLYKKAFAVNRLKTDLEPYRSTEAFTRELCRRVRELTAQVSTT